MTSRLKSSLTYANVMATVALFLALGGGAYAAIHLPQYRVRWAQPVAAAPSRSTCAAAMCFAVSV